jgi:riboflavin synthase
MFIGLIESLGRVARITQTATGTRIDISTDLAAELKPGDSLAVNGVCLTVVAVNGQEVGADISPETARVTTLGGLTAGSVVNLERSMRADARIGGHFVQGHVDATGAIEGLRQEGDSYRLTVRIPADLQPLIVHKGSIAIDGISLTVARAARDRFEVALIPETLARTTLGAAGPGARVNLEPSLRAGDQLGGHFVQGHVDGVGKVLRADAEGFEIEAPEEVLRYCVEKGSIAVEGVSLTIARLTEDSFEVALIPHTLDVTTLGVLRPGDEVNLETDVIARHVERLLER